MSGGEDVHGRRRRECAFILDEASGYFAVLDRDAALTVLGLAYMAGRQAGLEEWGAALDRLHGAFAEASE